MTDEMINIEPTDEMAQDAEQSAELRKLGADWLARIDKAEDDERKWIDAATKAEAAYSCDDEEGPVPDFNILHSNIETIVPSLYNSTPKPDIRPRHGSNHDGVKAAADVFERAASASIDDGALDAEMEDVVRDAELAGRGIIWLKFNADILEDMVQSPEIIYDSVSWRDFRMGPAKKWRDVPWVARLHTFSGTQLLGLSDEAIVELQLDPTMDRSEIEADERSVWEIWNKDGREVLFVEDESGLILKRTPDPLGLKNFFPCPKPVMPLTVTGKLTPVCPYSAYEVLAEELDRVTRRINALLEVLKVRGVIAGGVAEDLERLSQADDGELIVSSDLASLASTGGIDKGIMWWPIDVIIAVIRELMQQREAIKATIYEVTGISDIVRGASNAGETATAQQIKTQWGSLRIKKLQGMVQRSVREVFLLSVEIMAKHFPPEVIAEMAGVPLDETLMQVLSQPFNHLRIDVETDSTIRADLTLQRDEMSGFLAATGQFLQVAQPIMSENPQAITPLMEVYASFARQFNLGKQAEDAIEMLIAQSKQLAESGKDEQQQKKAEQMQEREFSLREAEAQSKVAESQARTQEAQAKIELDRERLRLESRKLDLEERKIGTEEIKALSDMEDEDLPEQPAGDQIRSMFENMLAEIAAQGRSIAEGQEQIAAAVVDGHGQIMQSLNQDHEEENQEGEENDIYN